MFQLHSEIRKAESDPTNPTNGPDMSELVFTRVPLTGECCKYFIGHNGLFQIPSNVSAIKAAEPCSKA